jgi:hypothetical protein
MEYVDISLNGTGITDNVITNNLELFFQEIQIAISVGPDGAWGSRDSIEISKYLFNQYVTVNSIQNEVQAFITHYCSQASVFQWTMQTQILNIQGKDLIYIEVTVVAGSSNTKFVQKYLMGS